MELPAPRNRNRAEARGREARVLNSLHSEEGVDRLSNEIHHLRRGAQRIPARIPVAYWSGRVEGQGIVCDVSRLGARISKATSALPTGTKVRIEFGALSGLASFTLPGEVVRQTDDGFALRFLDPDSDNARTLKPFLELISQQRESGDLG